MVFMEDVMAFRRKMNRRSSKKLFSRTADRTNRKNVDPRPMRGGIRL